MLTTAEYEAAKARAQEIAPGSLVLILWGEYYEATGEDARKIAAACDLTLTRTRNGDHLAGFPAYNRDRYVQEIIAAGHRVALWEPRELAAA